MPNPRPTGPLTLRGRVEHVSRPLLVRLSAMPRPSILIGTLALVVIGMLAPMPYALIPLAVVFAFVAWIAYLSWPAVSTGGRFTRSAMLALIVGLAWLRLYP